MMFSGFRVVISSGVHDGHYMSRDFSAARALSSPVHLNLFFVLQNI